MATAPYRFSRGFERLRTCEHSQPSNAIIHNASKGCIVRPPGTLGRELAWKPPFVMVSVLGTALPFGVTVVGLKEAVAPAGSPEMLSTTGLANPFAVGVMVI